MSKLLYIKANPKPEGQSRTFQISDRFIKSYKEKYPEDEIITLDVYKEEIHPLSNEDINSVFGPKNEASHSHPILKYAYQFVEADKYVIADPMWNLSIPAQLKAYIDYISVTGVTFKYTEDGAIGLCRNKKAIHITSRGGNYHDSPGSTFEMGDRYLRTILGFFGITDFKTISAEAVDVIGNDVERILQNAIQESEALLDQF